MSDPLTDTQRRVLDAVESESAAADIEDVETLVEVACHRPETEGADAASAVSRVAFEQPALVAEQVDSMLPLFAIDNPNIRWYAVSAVASLAEPEPTRVADTTAVANLQQAITDRDEGIRALTAEVLGAVGAASPELVDTEILPTLGRLARADPTLIDDRIETAVEARLGDDDEIETSLRTDYSHCVPPSAAPVDSARREETRVISIRPRPTQSRRRRRPPTKEPTHTVGYNYVKIFHTPGCRNTSRDYSRQYQKASLRRSARSAEPSSRPTPHGISVETVGGNSDPSDDPNRPTQARPHPRLGVR